MKRFIFLAAIILSVALVNSAEASVIINGSFESGSFYTPVDSFYAGDTTLVGWVINQNIEAVHSSFWAASDGNWSLDLNAVRSAGSIEQAFATTPGAGYLVTFDMAGNYAHGPVYTMLVEAAGQSDSFYFDRTGRSAENMGWTTRNFQFTANSSMTTLRFTNTSEGWEQQAGGPALDNVRVTEQSVVPEPASMALLGMGLAGLFFRRKQKI